MNQHLATRMSAIASFHVMDILARARQMEAAGRSVIHMEVGEPDFSTPQPIIDAGIQALNQGRTHYTPALGLSMLRQAISQYYADSYGVEVPAERIIITPGASGALLLALGVLINPGEQVLMTAPGYPCNRHFVRMFEGDAVNIAVSEQDAFQLQAHHIDQYWQTSTVAALVASPSNPTGTMLRAAAMQAMLTAVAARGGHALIDEIYLGLNYLDDKKTTAEQATTALAFSDNIFVINSFSKFFGMTGWRLGWLVVPEGYVEPVDRLAQNIFLAASTPAQYAALAAFEPETLALLDQRRLIFKQRRDVLIPGLASLGFEIAAQPQGAFYVYAGCSGLSDDSFRMAQELLEHAGVAITPGRDFGTNQAERYLRFAYTTSQEKLEQGLERIRKFLAL